MYVKKNNNNNNNSNNNNNESNPQNVNNVDYILKFPKIEKFLFESVEEGSTIKNYIDFKSMTKLNELSIDIDENFLLFSNFEKLPIESLVLYSRKSDNFVELKQSLEKVFLLKKLKKLIIATGDYNDEKILEISGKNISLEDL